MNNHIEQYLDYYTSLSVTPRYAIMLRGKWGSGKTWFIKDYMTKNGDEKFLYVSLYGISNFSEIEDAYFQQLHPVLASKGMKLAGKILKGIIKTTIKIDIDNDGNEDGSISPSFPDGNIPKFLKNIDDKILVFDDLERCSIQIHNILGYINQFVENNGSKVIVLANEDEIIKQDIINNKIEDSTTYLTIKEKLIGKSFDIKTDFDSAIISFVNEITTSKTKKLLNKKKNLIKEIFVVAGYNNLRHLRQTILDFERFYDFLPSTSLNKDDLLNHILKLFFTISFELKKGKITEDNIFELFIVDYFKSEIKEKTPAQLLKVKYFSLFGLYYHPINGELWTTYFRNGIVDKNELKISIENSLYFQEENTPNWQKLLYYENLNDDAFETIFKEVFREFRSLKIANKFVLVHVTCLLISLSDKNLITNKKKTIIKLAKSNIENLKQKGLLTIAKHERFPSDHSFGLAYYGLNIPENTEFLKHIKEQANISESKDYPTLANKLLVTLTSSIDIFTENITLGNSNENLYYDIPILKYIQVSQFVDSVLKLSNKDIQSLSWALEKRYELTEFIGNIRDEHDWLKSIYEEFEKEKVKRIGKISGHVIEQYLLKTIDKCINQLEQNPNS